MVFYFVIGNMYLKTQLNILSLLFWQKGQLKRKLLSFLCVYRNTNMQENTFVHLGQNIWWYIYSFKYQFLPSKRTFINMVSWCCSAVAEICVIFSYSQAGHLESSFFFFFNWALLILFCSAVSLKFTLCILFRFNKPLLWAFFFFSSI